MIDEEVTVLRLNSECIGFQALIEGLEDRDIMSIIWSEVLQGTSYKAVMELHGIKTKLLRYYE